MSHTDCTTCQTYLPDLLLDPQGASSEARAHLAACPDCRRELDELQGAVSLMDAWTAPEPSLYFDSRLHVRLREAQLAAPEGLWERFTSFLQYSTGRGLRPAMAGTLALAMLLGGGTAATVLLHHGPAASSSPTVNDLRIYDNNAQAVQQMDLLDDSANGADGAPQS